MINDVIVGGKNPTIEYGMQLLSCDPRSKNAVKAKQIGLQLVLMGMSEIQAKRISNLAVASYELEQKLFSAEILMTIDSKKLLSTYESINNILNESLSYVQNTSSMNWSQVIESLKELTVEDGPEPERDLDAEESQRTVSKTARELLQLATSGSNDD